MGESLAMDNRYRAEQEYSEQHVFKCCCGGIGFFRLNVEVGHPLFGKAIPCICKRNDREKRRSEELLKLAGISTSQYLGQTFEKFVPQYARSIKGGKADSETIKAVAQVRDMAKRYAQTLSGWLILEGPVGCGKTHLATAIAGEAINQKKSVYMSRLPDLLDLLRGTYNKDAVMRFEDVFDRIRQVKLLVIDDIGTESVSDWTREKLFQIVDYRYKENLPMILTTNVPVEKLGDRIDKRISSRLLDGSRVGGFVSVIRFPCGDFRPFRRA